MLGILSSMSRFTSITIIYNPNSTGSGKELAEELKRDLEKTLPEQTVVVTPTKHAGHAETLAYDLAKASKRALIISASGDGGYHEVVNGIMKAQHEGATPIAGLLPAGNANDHFHNLHEQDTVAAIKKGDSKRIDLLKLTGTSEGAPLVRYAHSYIGVGLTPKVGQELNKTDLNTLKEAVIVIKSLLILQPVRILVNGKKRSFDSLIFSNVGKMSKVLTLSGDAEINDGQFEVTAFKPRNKLKLLATLLQGATRGLKGGTQTDHYAFKTLKPTIVQADGEITTLDANSEVVVTLEPKTLECIV